jgi:hypothetical protein
MSVGDVLGEVEAVGVALRLEGEGVRIRFPEPNQRERLAGQINFLRAHRIEVAEFLRTRRSVPAMPQGVQLLYWNLRQPPIAIETCAVVTDPALFARSTLEQLHIASTEPKRWIGWSVAQLLDRLAQVGVIVVLEGSKGVVKDEGRMK